jgi:hypothetical protein
MDFLAGVLLSFPVWIIALLAAAGLYDRDHKVLLAFFAVLFAFITYKLFLPVLALVPIYYLIGGYIAAGVLWSVFKWIRYCDSITEMVRKGYISKEQGLHKIAFDDNIPDIVGWAAMWPFSFIGTALYDVFNVFTTLITRTFRGTYRVIADHFAGKINKL